MTKLEQKIHQELIKRFEENNWGTISLNMNDGGTILIHPLADETITCEDDVELWDITTYIDEMPEPNVSIKYTLEGVCCAIADFKSAKANILNTRSNLKNFYENNLKGHTAEELKLGNQVFEFIWQHSKDNDMSEALKDKNLLKLACDKLRIGAKTGEAALNLSMNFDTYSDWFKSVYSYRPRPFANGVAV